jgi:hypothetical protein
METTQQSILDLARTRGLLRPLDLAAHGLPRVSLTRLVRQGRLARVGRGLYALPDRGFKYRNKIGLDVALDALKEALGKTGQTRRASVDDLWRYARLCRVANLMRPYLEALA